MHFITLESRPLAARGLVIKRSMVSFAITLLISVLQISAFGQTNGSGGIVLSGKVTDENKEPLPGVSIRVHNTGLGAVSDVDGNFKITLSKPNELLTFSFIGYKTLQINSGNRSTINVELAADHKLLNEVVVVGYGTQERKNLIGSISKIDPAETKGIPTGSFDAQLQGKVAGVQISSSTGVPGEAINIRVRGATSINASNDPLYVLDGVFINSTSNQTFSTGGKATSPIADINPSDIESIEVLKDAEATALYGSRGANGVIIVTTKRGNYDQKAKINFSTSQGWAKAAKLWDLTTGPEHATLVNEWWINTGKDTPSLNRTEANRPFRPVSEGGRGLPEEQKTYDRLSEVFQTAHLQNYDLSLSGGTKTTKYYIGGGYNGQESILKPITFQRASFKVNLDQKVNDAVTVGVSNTFSRTFRNQARAGDGPAGGLLQAALHTPTYLSPTNENGELVGRAGFDNTTLLLKYYDVNSTSLRYIGNLYVEANILPNLKFRSSFGIDYNNYDESEYWNTYLIAGSPSGLATSSIGQYTTWINEQTLSYRKNLGAKSSFGILIGNTLQSSVSSRTAAEGRGFANNSFTQISSAAVTTSSQNWSKNTLTSFFARADYNYGGKYLVDVSVRGDASSRFGKDNKWGYFPAVGAAWRIKQEDFLKETRVISDLKLRTSYGITGNQNGIGDFAARGLWAGGSSYEGLPGIAPQQLANPNLRWEKTSQLNVGLDLGLFDQRITVELNAYRKYTSDGLLQVSLPGTSGFNTYWSNAAEISNKGFEFSIQTANIRKSDFTWTTNFNVARNVNKIEKLANPLRYGSRDLILQQQGTPLYSFWVYKQLYVDSQTGNTVYEDVNKDGKITVDDRQVYGSIWPKFFGGITNNFTYKGIDLGVFFAFQYGNKIYNHNKFFGEGGGARDAARVIFASNNARWQKPGDVTYVPRPDGVNVNNYRDGGSRWLEDGSFLRLRSLNLGYTIPKTLTNKLRIETLRLFLQGANLLTFTKYTGLDPESSASSAANQQGIDLGTPPQPRSIQVGLNITL
ncbi:TonB-linked outer membrane protein, SusC/RagA family [Dyadobacter koreensis]|uniref:TonB-linked outer membrane protein, SusC/RagA family n=1 Tax=Dyadobacter koreensis TaxID=408657 RepID=A0A1H6YIU8_9BACT|nr:TonB-dependent receptor [Dyadobacter koreensis]SEJ41243.1 TonB-linked outer membrane protein, SusC/RagA family [Dyadobacter koreensis]